MMVSEEREIRGRRRTIILVRLSLSMWLLGCGTGLLWWKPVLALLMLGLSNLGMVRWEDRYARVK